MIEPGTYRHFRGRLYQVIGTATHSETMEELVLYHPLYGARPFPYWVRPTKMWGELVQTEEGKVPRFQKVS